MHGETLIADHLRSMNVLQEKVLIHSHPLQTKCLLKKEALLVIR